MAAPVGGQIFSEILPYLEVVKGKKEEIQEKNEVEVPNVVGMSIQEAEKVLKECGLELELNKDCENELNENEEFVKCQTPSSGIKVYEGSHVFVDI